MNELRFITPTQLSLLDITSMGDSSKRGDDNTIGQFDSGLKYAIALLLRHNVEMVVEVFGGSESRGDWDEGCSDTFKFSTKVEVCDTTNKEKELIWVDVRRDFYGGAPMNQYDMREPSASETFSVKTSFAKNLGFDWELWQAYRELYSNMLDEDGEEQINVKLTYDEILNDNQEGTVITLRFDNDNPFAEIYKNRGKYINLNEPLAIGKRYDKEVKVSLNPFGSHLRIYKQSILVHEDENKPSKYIYDINFGELDERRLLRDVGQVEQDIRNILMDSDDEDFLSLFISPDFTYSQYEFLSNFSSYSYIGKGVKEYVHKVFEERGDVQSFSWLIDSVKKQKDCQLPGRKIESLNDHIWSSLATVTIESEPQEVKIELDNSLKNQIENMFNFTVDVCVKEADIVGRKVVADKFNKCLIVSKDFTTEDHMHEFLIQYVDLTMTGNIIDNLATMLKNALKK